MANCSQPHPKNEHPPTMSTHRTWLGPNPCFQPSPLNNNIDAWTDHLTNDIDRDYLLKGLKEGFYITSRALNYDAQKWRIINWQQDMTFATKLKARKLHNNNWKTYYRKRVGSDSETGQRQGLSHPIAADPHNTAMLIYTLTHNTTIHTWESTRRYHVSRVMHVWQKLIYGVLIDMCPFIHPTSLRQD